VTDQQAALTPEQQLRVLARIWGKTRGYIFLPTISGKARTPEARRKSYKEHRAYEWPRERDAIEQHLHDTEDDDKYFTPALFNARHRKERYVVAEQRLWADLDPVDPRSINGLRPNIAWETSPGRYQAVWLLDKPKVGASWYCNENHRLTRHVGADPSGWDSTQLLRVPGTVNHKPDYGEPVQGLLYLPVHTKPYGWRAFDHLPELPAEGLGDWADDEAISEVDVGEVRARIKLPPGVRGKLLSPSVSGDVSDAMWHLEMSLAEAAATRPR
jgi:RepB DNA-primase from phage plasmid